MHKPGQQPTRDHLVRQRTHCRCDLGPIRYPDLHHGHSSLPIEHNERRHSVDAELSRGIHTDRIQHVQSHHTGTAPQVTFQPIHDGLGHQTRTSKVRVKLDHLGCAVSQQRIQLLRRSQVSSGRPQQQKCSRYCEQDSQPHPILLDNAE